MCKCSFSGTEEARLSRTACLLGVLLFLTGVESQDLQDTRIQCDMENGAKCIVNVTIEVKRWLGYSVSGRVLNLNLLLRSSWMVPIASIEPIGSPFISMDENNAAKVMWFPDLQVSDRMRGGAETTSWEMRLFPSGRCEVVQQMIVSVWQSHIEVERYPFDTQRMSVRVASSKELSDRLELKASNDDDGVKAIEKEALSATASFSLRDSKVEAIIDQAALMSKSRIVLTIRVDRLWARVLQSRIIPDILVLLVAWTVTLFPASPQFSMPRAGTCSVTTLTIVTLRSATLTTLPPRSRKCWLEGFEDMCVCLAVYTVLINVFMETVYHKWKNEDAAHRIQRKAGIVFPLLALLEGLISVACIFLPTYMYTTFGMVVLHVLTITCCFFAFVAYYSVCYVCYRESATATPQSQDIELSSKTSAVAPPMSTSAS